MIRIVYLGRRWYGKKIESLHEDEENIMEFVEQGNPVIITDVLESLEQIDIKPSDVETVIDSEGDD